MVIYPVYLKKVITKIKNMVIYTSFILVMASSLVIATSYLMGEILAGCILAATILMLHTYFSISKNLTYIKHSILVELSLLASILFLLLNLVQ